LSFHQLCDLRVRQVHQTTGRNLLAEAERAYPGYTDRHRFDVQLPYALALTNEVLSDKYDAVVVDEAQDFSDEYWFAIEELLDDEELGHLYIFTDENQSLYPRHANLPVADEPFYLTTNCRNTSAIHEAGYAFYRGEPIDAPETRGIDVERIARSDLLAQADFIAQRLQRLILDDQIAPGDLAVLVARRPKAACYEALSRACAGIHPSPKLSIEHHGRAGHVLVDTVARFKGLESQAVLLWLGDEVVTDGMWETMYVGTTRAKTLLIVVGSALAAGCSCPT
jgi:superfamily I DNA and RNA helicase